MRSERLQTTVPAGSTLHCRPTTAEPLQEVMAEIEPHSRLEELYTNLCSRFNAQGWKFKGPEEVLPKLELSAQHKSHPSVTKDRSPCSMKSAFGASQDSTSKLGSVKPCRTTKTLALFVLPAKEKALVRLYNFKQTISRFFFWPRGAAVPRP